MSNVIMGNMVGGTAPIKTLIITDEAGNELTGVITEKEVIFTANAATDIREGKVAATGDGVVTGAKFIPPYNTVSGQRIITSGSPCVIPLAEYDLYDYTDLQCIICAFNTSLSNSVAAKNVVIKNTTYAVDSTELIASVEKDSEEKRIVLGITNNSDSYMIIRYFMYKEIE